MPLIPDVSVAAAWILPDEQTAYSKQILAQVRTEGAVVPALWLFELANILVVALRRNRITSQEVRDNLADLEVLPILIDEPGALGLSSTLLWLAFREGLTAYDASYLELAIRRRLPMASNDTQLRAAALRLGVSLL
jgi:predicted nucleic acid-binding protein